MDLSRLEGITVLGEPLAVIFSGLLRLRLAPERDGLCEMSGDLLTSEAEAIARAMARAERKIPGDRRTRGQRDCDRFMVVVERVKEVSGAVLGASATRRT